MAGVDNNAQVVVAEQMKKRAAKTELFGQVDLMHVITWTTR